MDEIDFNSLVDCMCCFNINFRIFLICLISKFSRFEKTMNLCFSNAHWFTDYAGDENVLFDFEETILFYRLSLKSFLE